MSETTIKPFYQDIDGLRLPGVLNAEAYRGCLKYEPTADDIFVATFPKCGTTWTQQIVSLILNKGQPFGDYIEFSFRTPFLEMLGTEGIDMMVRPGCIKTHLPYHITPMSKDAKYIYVVRNPKDTVVSLYHHTATSMYKYQNGKFNDFFELFLAGETDWNDYFDHVLGWYEHRNDPNVLFFTYEELKRKSADTLRKIGRFMGGEYQQMLEEDDTVLNNVLKYSSVEYMKTSINESFDSLVQDAADGIDSLPTVPLGLRKMFEFLGANKKENENQFRLVRKGIVGDWRSNFTEDQAARMDAKIESRLKGTEIYDYWKSINCI